MNRQSFEDNLRPIVAGTVLLLTLVAVLGTAIRDPRPHDIPVGLSAPPPVAEQLIGAFGQAAPGAFAFTSYGSEAEARAAIARRDVVGTLVVGEAGPRLIVAGAAGDAISGGVTAAFTNAFRAQGAELTVETVHPFPAGDPHGIVAFFLILATVAAAVVAGALTVLPASGRSWVGQVGVVATFAVSAGILGTLTAAWLADGFGDGLWLVMAIVALLSLAVGLVVVAAGRIMGPAGVALAALVVVLLGLVSSGGPLGSEFLPDAYRALAPWLPVGPAYSAVRGALSFGGEGVIGPVAVLVGWAIVGAVALAASGLVRPVASQPAVAHA